MAVDYVGMDVRATFGESGLNSGRITWLFDRPDPFYASLLSIILLHFAADRAALWGHLSPIAG